MLKFTSNEPFFWCPCFFAAILHMFFEIQGLRKIARKKLLFLDHFDSITPAWSNPTSCHADVEEVHLQLTIFGVLVLLQFCAWCFEIQVLRKIARKINWCLTLLFLDLFGSIPAPGVEVLLQWPILASYYCPWIERCSAFAAIFHMFDIQARRKNSKKNYLMSKIVVSGSFRFYSLCWCWISAPMTHFDLILSMNWMIKGLGLLQEKLFYVKYWWFWITLVLSQLLTMKFNSK